MRAKNALNTYNINNKLLEQYLKNFYESDFYYYINLNKYKFKNLSVEDIEDTLQECLLDMTSGRIKTSTSSYDDFKKFVYVKLKSRLIDLVRCNNMYNESLDDIKFDGKSKYEFIADKISCENIDPYEVICKYYDSLHEDDFKHMMNLRAKKILRKSEYDMYQWFLTHTIPGFKSPKQVDYAKDKGIKRNTANQRQKSYINKLSKDLLFKLLLYCVVSCQKHYEVSDPKELRMHIEGMYI